MCACSWVRAQRSPFLSVCLCPRSSLACRAEAIILALGLLLYTITVIFHSHFHCFNFREFPFLFLTFSCFDLSRNKRESHLKNATNSQQEREVHLFIMFGQARCRDQHCCLSGKPVNSSICALTTENPHFRASGVITAAGK